MSHGSSNDPTPGAAGKKFSIAFGIERIGLIPLRVPKLAAAILLALCVVAVFGIQRIKIDDSLSQLFRSDTPEYKQYEEVTKRFPSSEYDVLVVVEGKTLLERSSLEKLRDLVTDLQLVDGTRGIISLFSARQPPENGKLPAALFPETLPEGKDYDAFIQKVKSNEVIRGKLLSEDGTLALIVLALDPQIVGNKGLNTTIGEVRKAMAEDLEGTGLTSQLSGVPVMQLEIRNAVERDGLTYNIAGILAGCIIAHYLLPPHLIHDRCGLSAAAGDPALDRCAGVVGIQPQHVPERDDPVDHGHQFLGLHAIDVRGPRPAHCR